MVKYVQLLALNNKSIVDILNITHSSHPENLAGRYVLLLQEIQSNIGHVKQKSAFQYTQNAQTRIILHMCMVSSGHLLSIETFNSSH